MAHSEKVQALLERAYKKYVNHCLKERQLLIEQGCEVDFQRLSFEQFLQKLKTDKEFSKVWDYYNL